VSTGSETKQNLGSALITLLEKMPFEKITVGDLCAACHMSRKNFYYHFRDKFDLLTWVCESHLLSALRNARGEDLWAMLEALCDCMAQNRSFYEKALHIEGQNGFAQCFCEVLAPVVRVFIDCDDEPSAALAATLFLSGFLKNVELWLPACDRISPREFCEKLRRGLTALGRSFGA